MASTPGPGSVNLLAGHSNVVWACAFSHDGSHVATASSDGTARVWLLAGSWRGQEVARLKQHSGVVRGCGFSPNPALLATCSWDETIHIHSCSNFLLTSKLTGHQDAVASVRFSPSGCVLASTSWDRSVGVWDVQTTTPLNLLWGHSSTVTACVFLQDGGLLASSSWDKSVRVWDLSSSPRREVLALKSHPNAVYGVSSAGQTEPNLLASCGREGTLILWDLRNPAVPWQVVQSSLLDLNCVCFSPAASSFLTGDSMGDVHLWDMSSIKMCSTAQPAVLHAHASSVSSLCFSPDGSLFASSSSDYTCRVWDSGSAFTPSISSLADSLANHLSLENQ